ncbi:MAG TPA: hypothetical protein VIG51_13200 [Candidatus Baltobacteraceae bacterium]|jgi:hypothetical protein
MFDVSASLAGALTASQHRLSDAAAATARAQTTLGSAHIDGAMAGIAQCAIFTEALLAATHARLEEIKTVTK